MKKLFFSALVAVAAIGAANATVGNSSQKLLANTYYLYPCHTEVTCNEDPGTPCNNIAPLWKLVDEKCEMVLIPGGNFQ